MDSFLANWAAGTGTIAGYRLDVATSIDFTSGYVASNLAVSGTSQLLSGLDSGATYYYRVRATNACGVSLYSSVFAFTTVAAPGDCAPGTAAAIAYQYGFEAGASGWTHSAAVGADSWAIVATNPHSGASHFRGLDPASITDQRLVSPAVALPTGQNLSLIHISEPTRPY